MPATTNASTTTGLKGRGLQRPSDDITKLKTLSPRSRPDANIRIESQFAAVLNGPWNRTWIHALRERLKSQQGSADTAQLQSSRPEPAAPSKDGLTLHIRPLSSEADFITRRAFAASALMSISVVSSDCWRQGPALCVLGTDSAVVCRVSPHNDGGITMKPTDASIMLVKDDPQTFQALKPTDHGTGFEYLDATGSFCHALAYAIQWRLISLQIGPDDFRDAMVSRERELLEAMLEEMNKKTSLYGHLDYVEQRTGTIAAMLAIEDSARKYLAGKS